MRNYHIKAISRLIFQTGCSDKSVSRGWLRLAPNTRALGIRFARVKLIKTHKIKVMSVRFPVPHEPAASCSRYQSTLWSATVPQLCSGRPQVRALQATIQHVRHSDVFVGLSRIINENLSKPPSHPLFIVTSFFRAQTHIFRANAIAYKFFTLVINFTPQTPAGNISARVVKKHNGTWFEASIYRKCFIFVGILNILR